MVLTVAPIVGTSHDTPAARLFVPAVNNWIRNSLFPWRVVDAEQILPNPYDTNLVSDAVHPQPAGYTNIIYAINKELFAPAKTMWPQRWVNAYGTNIVVSVPGATNAAPVVAAQFSASGFFLPTNSSAWPAASPSPGGCCFVNSNGTVYLLNCPPGSTSWSATNLLGHP